MRKRKILSRLTICLGIVILMASFSWSAVFAEASGSKTVKVGYYENEVFEEGAEEGAVKTGYAYEYYRKLSEYTGWRYEYVYGSFGDLYQKLLDGEIDLLAGLAYLDERAETIGYPDAAMGNESYYLVKHDTDRQTTYDPDTLNGKKIGVLNNAMVDALYSYLSEQGINAEVITYSDHKDLFTAFDTKALDIMAVEGDGAYGRDHAEILTVFGTSVYYICVNKDRQDLLDELNEAQSQLASEEPNFINSLKAKYYSQSVTARAFSSAEKDWLDAHSELHIGYLKNYLPYSDTGSDGNVTGMVSDIVSDMLRSLGIDDLEVSYTGYESYDDMIEDMSKGTIDAAFPVGGGLYYSEENGIYQSSAVVSAPTEIIFQGEFTEDTIKQFAVNENNRMQYYYVRSNYPDAEIKLYPSIDDCLKAVLSGEAGCTTLNALRANDILKNREYNSLSMRQGTRNDDRSFGVEIGNEGLLKLLNRGINVLGSEYAQNISYRYTEGLYSYSFSDMLRDHMGAVGSLILAIAALIIFLLVRDRRRSRDEIRQREKNQKELSDALTRAEEASRAKTTFLNNMSHDIRTPMNAIVGFTSLAESHIDDKELVQDYLDKISVSSRHLLSLINDILDMSRIESGRFNIEESEVHLPDLISELETIVRSNIGDKNLDLTIDPDGIVHEDIITDKLRLNQVLLNILSNAVKFTPEGGSIRFSVTERPSGSEDAANYEFRVRDTGIGMSEEFRKTIFDAFTRERSSTVSGIQGTGLGMAITKNIVDMMGGEITVNSEEGKGSEFIVVLPCRIAHDTAKLENKADSVSDLRGRRVLLAEDNVMNQMIAEKMLTDAGMLVEIASDGQQTVDMVASAPAGHYDIILMDVQMPNMDGYEATRRIRGMEDQAKAGVPIVAVTANAFEEDRNTALDTGMNGHLAKPYDIPAIMKTIGELVSDPEA